LKRVYNTETNINVDYFTGIEVEHTPMLGKKTLFVVGVHNADQIQTIATANNCKHIYLGANMSFDVTDNVEEQWQPWESMAKQLLNMDFWVTLDVDINQVEGLLETGLTEYNKFIPMISAKLPYIQQLGYNACLKIDDKDFDTGNPGVWVHAVHDLMDRSRFTGWDKYTKDQPI